MDTPICDFVRQYEKKRSARLHMPGHKGITVTGPEAFDITEIAGADELYSAKGIIRESEDNAAALFGSARTFYSAEGSSLCDTPDWAKADVDRLSAAGLVKGYGDGTLGAADRLTVEQVGILMERLSGLLN